MCGFLYDVGEAIPDGVDAAGRAVSRGLDAVNNACNQANDSMEAIIETVVSSPDILADMIADSIVGQYWSDFWDLNVDSVNAIEGILEDMAEELANDEDVPGFIRDYMNGLIGADVPCNFLGVVGAGCRGVEEMLSGVYKGASGVLGHPCQTGENIADALIIAGEATKYFIEDPQKATENAISSVSDWWNDKTTYEKIRTVVEAYIMYRMIASGGSKGETVTLESEAAGMTEEAAKTGEVAEEAAKAGEVAEEAAKAGAEVAEEAAKAGAEVAEDAAKAGGKGKVKIESAGTIVGLSKHNIEHVLKNHTFGRVKKTIERLMEKGLKGSAEKLLDDKTFFNRKWSEKEVVEAVNRVYNEAVSKGITKGEYTSIVSGEKITVCFRDGGFHTAYGKYEFSLSDFGY